jgi:hypothetical protein
LQEDGQAYRLQPSSVTTCVIPSCLSFRSEAEESASSGFGKEYNWHAIRKSQMRIVTWNCCGKFARKANELLALNPDIAIVPESLLVDSNSLEKHGYRSIWFGDEG